MDLPYRIIKKDSKFFPQLMENYFARKGTPQVYNDEAGARKFLKKQAANRLLLAEQQMKKHGVYATEFCQYAQQWFDEIDNAPIVEIPDTVVAPVVKERRVHTFGTVVKYIVAEGTDERGNVHELPILFPYILVHADMADTVRMAAREADLWKFEIVGAGFVSYSNGEPNFHGESESLGIKSRGIKDRDAFNRCEKNTTSTLVRK